MTDFLTTYLTPFISIAFVLTSTLIASKVLKEKQNTKLVFVRNKK